MNLRTKDKLINYSTIFFIFKTFLAIIVNFKSFQTPHLHRQIDTIGVSFRFWQKFNFEPFDWTSFLPSVLNSGDTTGIMPMEFPFINLLLSPFFGIPIENKVGLVYLIYILITCFILFWNYRTWRDIKILDIRMDLPMALLPLSSVFINFSTKIIPDIWANLFIIISVGYLIKFPKKQIQKILLVTLGLLIKPTAIVGLAPLLLVKKEKLLKSAPYIFLGLLITLFYYKWCVQIIDYFREGPSLFYYSIHSIKDNLLSFSQRPSRIIKLIDIALFIKTGSFILLSSIFYLFFKRRDFSTLKLIALICLQFFSISLLRGDMIYVHLYYFIGAVPLINLLTIKTLKGLNSRVVTTLVILIFCIKNFEVLYGEVKPLVSEKKRFYRIRKQCKELKARNPNFPWNSNYIFRSPMTQYPELGICFQERSASKTSTYGFSFKDNPLTECKKIDYSSDIVLYKCKNQTK